MPACGCVLAFQFSDLIHSEEQNKRRCETASQDTRKTGVSCLRCRRALDKSQYAAVLRGSGMIGQPFTPSLHPPISISAARCPKLSHGVRSGLAESQLLWHVYTSSARPALSRKAWKIRKTLAAETAATKDLALDPRILQWCTCMKLSGPQWLQKVQHRTHRRASLQLVKDPHIRVWVCISEA